MVNRRADQWPRHQPTLHRGDEAPWCNLRVGAGSPAPYGCVLLHPRGAPWL